MGLSTGSYATNGLWFKVEIIGDNFVGHNNILNTFEWNEGEMVQTQNWLEARRSTISNAFHTSNGATSVDAK
jgi:hypothetical protein